MKFKRTLAATIIAAAFAVGGSANAVPLLQIETAGGGTPGVALQEQSGDPGGSVYPFAGGAGPGAGLPWQQRNQAGAITGGWPTGPGMGPDVSFTPNWGTTGWHTVYLRLTEAANVTFQFMGAGNSSFVNDFRFNVGGVDVFTDGVTNPCAVTPGGATVPTCTPGVNQKTIPLAAGLVPFQFFINSGSGFVAGPSNNGTNGNPDPTQGASFMLGVDPYLALGTYQTSGRAVYVGLSDRPETTPDHDFQDMGVRISVVPEPGSLALLGAALFGLAGLRRRVK